MARRRPDVGKLMRTITSRFVMLVATAAVAPLVLYGAVSIYSLRTGSRQRAEKRKGHECSRECGRGHHRRHIRSPLEESMAARRSGAGPSTGGP